MPDRPVEILDRAVVFGGYFQMVRYRLRHWQFAGGLGPDLTREVLARGHAAAVLPYDPVRDEVVLIEQFRAGALEAGWDPWLLEPVAGMLEDGETAEELVRREAVEEAGLEVLDLAPVCTCLPSPGGSSEVIHVFVGRADTTAAGGIFGLAGEGEDIKAHVLPYGRAAQWLDEGRLQAASTLLAMQWLARHHETLRRRWRQPVTLQAS